jgi:diacylglycerol O-acyltransferase
MTKDQLGGLDTALLYCETPGMHMHVCGIALLDPSPAGPGDMFEPIRSLLLAACSNVPMMRKRVATIPFGLARPLWVDDAAFDLDRHLHRVRVAEPGDDRALADLIGAVAGVPLPHDRPLWEVWVVEGLADGRVGLLAKIHHAGIDGATALEVMGQIFRLRPGPADAGSAPSWRPRPGPSALCLLGTGLASAAQLPSELVRLLPPTAWRLGAVLWRRRRSDARQGSSLFRAPRTSFNATLTPARSAAFADVPFSEVKQVTDAYGVKVNDVIVAVVAGALRRYLEGRGELPSRPLVAAQPVSEHDRSRAAGGTTRLSVMFSPLATDQPDPAERLRTTAAANARAKEVNALLGADTLMRWSEYVWTYGYRLGARLYSALHLADHHPVVHNLLLSNVPGPPVDLYLAGARCVAIYPFGPIFDGAGLTVTAITTDNRLGFGLTACPDLVPDVWEVAEGIPASFRALFGTIAGHAPVAIGPGRPQRGEAPPSKGTRKVPARSRSAASARS